MDSEHTLNAEDWIEKYGDLLYAYARVRVSDTVIAEDIVQETFLNAWKNKASYKGIASEKTWLFAICKNKIIDHYRKRSNSPVSYGDTDNTNQYFDDRQHWATGKGPGEWGVNYKQPVETKEFYKMFESCKEKLQELQRSVFVLKYLEDADAKEICKVLNISSSNYWVLMHRAKLQLRECIEKNWIKI